MKHCNIHSKCCFSAQLNFLWAVNKLAIVEEETRVDYVTYQYEIDDRWILVISKNENPEGEGPHPKWILSRVERSEKLTPLLGVRKIYHESKSKNSSIQ